MIASDTLSHGSTTYDRPNSMWAKSRTKCNKIRSFALFNRRFESYEVQNILKTLMLVFKQLPRYYFNCIFYPFLVHSFIVLTKKE